MDDRRFDTVTRLFARPASRRRTLAGVVAAALAPLTNAAAGPEPAKCLADGKRCRLANPEARHADGKNQGSNDNGNHRRRSCAKCCSRYGAPGPDGKARCACKPDGLDCANPSQCCGGLCRDGKCTNCPDGLTDCDGECVDLRTDDRHCGACDKACDAGQRCVGGRCICDATSCPRGCCDAAGACQRGTSDQACGANGADCQICGACASCDGTRCAPTDGACCDAGGGVCRSGSCVACDAGQRCHQGQCVCDATSCADGCCDGQTCVRFADQTNQRCGKGGEACRACTGHDTCGGGGKQGVCGCTPQCEGKSCDEPNGCGAPCGCPECQACHAGGICEQVDDGTPCGGEGSGSRCCGGTCPPPPPCLPNETCCDQGTTCKTCCGTVGFDSAFCPGTGGHFCVESPPFGNCTSDAGCNQSDGTAICRCGQCCLERGGACGEGVECCSGVCDSPGVCA